VAVVVVVVVAVVVVVVGGQESVVVVLAVDWKGGLQRLRRGRPEEPRAK
jgi:hypothetical protein